MEVNKERVKAFVNATKEDAIAASSSDIPSKYNDAVFVRSLGKYKIIDVAYCGHQQVCLSLTPW